MILQALKEYYERKQSADKDSIAPEGWEYKEIRYVLTIDRNGGLINIDDNLTIDGNKKKSCKKYLVPKGETRTSGIKPFLLWDSAEYALCIFPNKNSEKQESLTDEDLKKQQIELGKAKNKNRAFIEKIKVFKEQHGTEDEGIKALLAFYEKNADLPALIKEKFPNIYENMLKGGNNNCSFIFQQDLCLICERPEIKELINAGNSHKDDEKQVICLVSGEKDSPARLHPQIKGVSGSNPTGASVVSFNLSAFCSYGKKQGENAQTGEKSAFAYGTALNSLLGKYSQQKIYLGDSTVIFWADKNNDLEGTFQMFFNDVPKDNPNAAAAVKNLFNSIKSGVYAENDSKTEFYVLGLSPNSARIAVRFWIKAPVSGIKRQIKQHFDDMEIIAPPSVLPYLSIYRILSSSALEGKKENIPPKLAGDLMYSILQGTPYPQNLLNCIINRIKAEHNITYVRAAALKAIINRNIRFRNSKEDIIKVSLDKETENIPYRLGRLFAVLEKIQAEAQPGINSTIRERFYGAASSTPVAVFGNLMRLKNHHLAKIESTGRKIHFENLLSEIIGSLPARGFPAHLDLQEQGRFAIGYYHQMRDFYTKKEKGE